MGSWLIPRILLPDFVWSTRTPETISSQIPEPPRTTHPWLQRVWGILHRHMRRFSRTYCRWVGITYDNQIAQLPFGLILKWSDGTRLEEVLTMQAMRRAGLPVPKVLCYGDHPEAPHAPVSILMTRVAGDELGGVWKTLSECEKESIRAQLGGYLDAMRAWESPWGKNRICSFMGTSVRSVRVPMHRMGPFESEQELNEYLRSASWSGGFPSEEAYNSALERAQRMDSMPHRIVFTHGDLQHHNILVHIGRITGILDWEAAAWLPEYWEFTTPLSRTSENSWWYNFVAEIGGSQYTSELDSERAMVSLTSASYYW
ncbi:kinase-like protein [Aspergillus unguis]